MFQICKKCSSKTLSHEDFNVDLISNSDSENSNIRNWIKKMIFKESIDSAIRNFTSAMTLKHYIYVKRVQFNHYNSIKSNLGRNNTLFLFWLQWGLLKQTAAWDAERLGHMSFSIFTACCYLRGSEDNLIRESITLPSVNFPTTQEPLQLPAYKKLLKILERSTNIYHCESMFSFEVMSAQLSSGL